MNDILRLERLWLMASYVYYNRDDVDNLLDDDEFDYVNQTLLDNHDKVSDELITKDRLQACTAFDIKPTEYAKQTRYAAIAPIQGWTLAGYLNHE